MVAAAPVIAATDVEYLRAGKFTEAKNYLERALQNDPGSAALNCNLGIALLRLRDYQNAYMHLNKATTLQPDLVPAWLNMAACLVCMGEFERAIEAYKRVQVLAPSPALNGLIASLQTQRMIDETSADYYQNGWRRWNKGATIKLFVSHHPRYRDIAIRAMQTVVSAANADLQLEAVTDQADANVVCLFIEPPSNAFLLERGIQSSLIKNGKIVGAAVQIHLSKESGLDYLSDDTVRKSCLHEFMHTLGIAGHSANVEDIMFPMIELPTVEPRLSARDKATLQRLYSCL